MLSYQKALSLLEKRGIKLYQIISSGKIRKAIREGDYITTKTLEKLCDRLDCQPGDIVEYISE